MKKLKFIFYLLNIILIILYVFITNHGFEVTDLFDNILGVLLSIIIIKLYYSWRSNESI